MVQKKAQIRTGCLLLVILALGMVVPVTAATNTIGYFSLPTITERCSTNIGHENQCPIFGMFQEVAKSATTPEGPTFTFRITKPVDKASPLLLLEAASTKDVPPQFGLVGRQFPSAAITLSQTGTSSAFFVTLENVRISGVKQYTNPDSGSPYGVLEEVTFSYERIKWKYLRVQTGWDLLANRPTLTAPESEAGTTGQG